MLKALAIKELRESVGILALAAIATIYALASLTGVSLLPFFGNGEPRGIPFVADELQFYLNLIIGGMAIALGLKQSAWEFGHNTYYFLLHRPIRRASVFWTKLAVGSFLTLALGAVIVLIYSIWAATPGKSGVPFAWSMTVPAWESLLCLGIVYLSAFLCGVRPARWFGTRLAPAVAGIGFATFLFQALWWWLLPLAALAVAMIFLLAIFYYVARRDY